MAFLKPIRAKSWPFDKLMFTEFAPAKINLSLRVHTRRSDGFHDLTSLVAFADVGDRISFAPSDLAGGSLTLAYTGDYGGDLQQALDGDDIVLSAARLFGAGIAGVLTLEKNLPVMAGMGGGSADAAAVLRLFQRLQGENHHDRAVELGSDVPVCLLSRAAWMRGRGEQVAALSAFPECPAVLVNAGSAMPTGPVFHALGRDRPEAADAMTTPGGLLIWMLLWPICARMAMICLRRLCPCPRNSAGSRKH